METILIIDDEPVGLSFLRDMLGDEDYRFECAASSREAREIVATSGERIQTILLDWILPDSSGVELLEWLQAQPSLANVEVVVQSAEFEAESIERGIDCGAYYYLTKPFGKAQLKAIVRAAISSCELKRDLARRVEQTRDAFGLLAEGVFRFQTVSQAKLLSVHLGSAADDPQVAISLLELMINAVEHGNLRITYDEKTALLKSGRLQEEIAERIASERYRDCYAELRVVRRADCLELVIEDEGVGFDFERYLTIDPSRLFDSHGRGIVLAGSALEIRYVEPGNIVEVRLPCT